MIIRTLDEAEAAVREILSADDPRRALLKMPQLIATSVGTEVRTFLEAAQRRMGERYGTRVMRKPVVIEAEPPSDVEGAAQSPASRVQSRAARKRRDARPVANASASAKATADKPAEKPAGRGPTPGVADSAGDPAADKAKRPSVPRLRPFGEQAKPKEPAAGASMRTADPHTIAAELAAAQTGAHALPPYASRPRERTEVVTLLGESDIVPVPGEPPREGTTKILDRPASPRSPPRAASGQAREASASARSGQAPGAPRRETSDGNTSVVDAPAPSARPASAGARSGQGPLAGGASAEPRPAPPRRKSELGKTRVYPEPSLEPVPAAPRPKPPPADPIPELTASRVLGDDISTTQFLRGIGEPIDSPPEPPATDDVQELSAAQMIGDVEDLGVRRAMEREQVEKLPEGLRDVVQALGAAQTLHGDRVIRLPPVQESPAARLPASKKPASAAGPQMGRSPMRPVSGGAKRSGPPPARTKNEVLAIDAAELEALVKSRPAAPPPETADDDDVMELDAAHVIEAPGVADSAELFGSMLAEDRANAAETLEPIDVTDAEDDDATREIEGDPVAALLTPTAAPSEAPTDGDPDNIFDSIEGALKRGVLPLDVGRQGLSANEAGELFQAFLEAAGGAAANAEIGEETIVMDRGAAPRRTGGGGGRVDAITLFRVIRRIFAETHQRLPAWLVARTIMSDPANVLQLAIGALRRREEREFLAYKETVAELFQHILAARLQWGKTADAMGRYLRRVVETHAPATEHERLAVAIDAVLMSDRRIAEVQGYGGRGVEGERAALSLLESLAPGRAQE